MVESFDRMVTESLKGEIAEFHSKDNQLTVDRVEHNSNCVKVQQNSMISWLQNWLKKLKSYCSNR